MAALKESVVRRVTGESESEPLVFSDARLAAEHIKLPLYRKLGYAVGAMPYAMCTTVMGFYLSLFLLEVALLSPLYVLVIVLLGRVWDAVTDPIVGFLCGRTKTKLGQFRPWILFSALPVVLVYIFLWFIPPWDIAIKFAYFLCIYLMVQALLSCVHVPYTALTVHMSYSQRETDSVTAYRMVCEVLGTVVGIAVYTASYAIFVRDEQEDCTSDERISDPKKQKAYLYHAVALGVVSITVLLITFFTVKEQKEEVSLKHKLSFWQGIKHVFGFKPYRELIFMELFSWLAVQFVQGNFAFYVKYTLGLSDQYTYVVAALLVCSILWMPINQLILLRFGKKTTYGIAMWSLMPGLIILLFIDYFPLAIYPLAVFGALGVSAAYLLPWSMLPDVVNAAALEYGVRREEFFYAFFVFGNKFGAGVTLAISTGIYELGGYDQLSCDQPWTVPLMFKLLVSAPPVLFIVVSLIFLHRYPINEEFRKRMKEKLARRRSKPHPAGNLDNDEGSSHSHMTMSDNFEDQFRKSVLPDSPDSSGTLEGKLLYSPQTNL